MLKTNRENKRGRAGMKRMVNDPVDCQNLTNFLSNNPYHHPISHQAVIITNLSGIKYPATHRIGIILKPGSYQRVIITKLLLFEQLLAVFKQDCHQPIIYLLITFVNLTSYRTVTILQPDSYQRVIITTLLIFPQKI